MKNIIIYILSRKRIKDTISICAIVLGCIIIFSHCQSKATNLQSFEESNKLSITPINYKAVVYVPNSYIIDNLKKLLFSKPNQIYDTAQYEFYSLRSGRTRANNKEFILKLLKRPEISFLNENSEKSLNKMSKKSLIDWQKEIYAPENFIEKIITISKDKSSIAVKYKGISNDDETIFGDKYLPMEVSLQDSTYNILQTDLKSLNFYKSGIVVNFSQNSQSYIDELVNFLETKYELQNSGVSVIYPYSFLSQATKDFKIHFDTENPYLKGIYINKISIKNGKEGQINASFEIDNNNRALFPRSIQGTCIMTKENNIVQSMDNFNYKRENLSVTDIQIMNMLINVCQDSVAPKLINKSLVPTISGALMSVRFGEKEYATTIHSSNMRYYNNSVIYKINLNNE